MRIQGVLQELPFFASLTDSELDLIMSISRLVEGNAGDSLIREGEQVRTLYVMLSGEAEVIRVDAKWNRVVIASVGKGALLGEMSLVDSAPASATIEAKGAFRALAIEQEKFNRLTEEHPNLGCKIFKQIARTTSHRLRKTSGLLAEYMPLSSPSGDDLGE